ncbi:hypothetical protein H5410_061392 [Solanum commersonii]|uniref:Uncharacterized protein n=1 Tax=Solanum commersonii TaxID=4109 RepID=A0A9J5W7V6_SOLCO|nr:hypothetical protein H5410_061392 [Solanum commersonii]
MPYNIQSYNCNIPDFPIREVHVFNNLPPYSTYGLENFDAAVTWQSHVTPRGSGWNSRFKNKFVQNFVGNLAVISETQEEASFEPPPRPHDLKSVSVVNYTVEEKPKVSIEERLGVKVLVVVIMKFDGEGNGYRFGFKNQDTLPAKPSIDEPEKFELKALPSHVRYEFLSKSSVLHVIIDVDFNKGQVEALILVLKWVKRAISWTIANIIGSMFDKLGGMIIIPNAKNELFPVRPITGWRMGNRLQSDLHSSDRPKEDYFHFSLHDVCFQEDVIQISEKGIKDDRDKVEVIEKLPPPISEKGVRSFQGHAGFYKRFIKDFSNFVGLLSSVSTAMC